MYIHKPPPIPLLRRRIEKEYADFKSVVLLLDRDSIFELAPIISAVNDVHFYLTTHDWADDYEAEYLLRQENTLYYIAEVWKEELEDLGRHFGRKLTEAVINGSGFDCSDLTAADELRIKYGDELPLNTAALLEIVELGRKFLRYAATYDADDCDFPNGYGDDDDYYDAEDDV
jgi:hypothetical protein